MSECELFNVNCPNRRLLDEITDKWSVMILTALDQEPLRFNGIKRRLVGITQKVLTQSLRRLERNGMVARRVLLRSPIAVEYRLTGAGRTVLPPITALYEWAIGRLPDVELARQRFDERAGNDDADDGLADDGGGSFYGRQPRVSQAPEATGSSVTLVIHPMTADDA